MIDTGYKRFIRHLLAAATARRMSYKDMAAVFYVHENTVRNWMAFRTIMPGDAVLRAIMYIMGGEYQC